MGMRAGTILSIVGVSFCQENVRQMKEDDVVTLKHDMSNEYDKHAITVLDSKGNRLGFLPKTIAGRFSDPTEGGTVGGQWSAVVVEITSFEEMRGLRVKLSETV
jgi:hypothetical protein